MNCQNELDPSVKYAAINDTKLNVIKGRDPWTTLA